MYGKLNKIKVVKIFTTNRGIVNGQR
jgi:hypothetical protein